MPKRQQPHYQITDFSSLDSRRLFLQAVFGDDWEEKAFLVNEPHWSARRKLDTLDDTRGCYWCVGAIPPGLPRKNENVETVRALVLDDVGTKIDAEALMADEIIGTPTALVCTSDGNFQAVYRFEVPARPEAFNAYRQYTMARIPGASDGKDAAHLFRLPWGVNRKPGRNSFAVNGALLGFVNTAGKLPLTAAEVFAGFATAERRLRA